MAETLFRVANGLFAAMFLFSVAVQYNDPDPVQWMLVYGAATALSASRAYGARIPPALGYGLVGIAAAWAAWIVLHTRLEVPLMEALGQWDMHSGGSEEARETGGLLLVVVWSALATAWRPRAPSLTIPTPS